MKQLKIGTEQNYFSEQTINRWFETAFNEAVKSFKLDPEHKPNGTCAAIYDGLEKEKKVEIWIEFFWGIINGTVDVWIHDCKIFSEGETATDYGLDKYNEYKKMATFTTIK